MQVQIDSSIDKIKEKGLLNISKKIILVLTIFLILDCIATCIAQRLFLIRMIEENNIQVENKDEISKLYDTIYNNETLSQIIYTVWGDRKMIRTFPNMRIGDKDGNIIYIDSLLKHIQPYYMKIRSRRLKNEMSRE